MVRDRINTQHPERNIMTFITNTRRPLFIAAALTLFMMQPALAADVQIIDPSTGLTTEISDVNFRALTEEQRNDVRAQLLAQGLQIREDRPERGARLTQEERAAISVTDPVSGDTVALSEIDVRSLSDEDRATLRADLEAQGIEVGPRGPRLSGGGEAGEGRPDRGARGGNGGGRGGNGGGNGGGPRG